MTEALAYRIPNWFSPPEEIIPRVFICGIDPDVPLVAIAFWYRELGFNVVPVHEKHAVVPWKELQSVRATDQQVRKWFEHQFPDCGIAVINGSTSGNLACRDFDDRNSYWAWADAHPELAATLATVVTYSGFHVYFRHEPGKTEMDRTGELRVSGYNVLPPSIGRSGYTYAWVRPPDPSQFPLISDLAASGLWLPDQQRDESHAAGSAVRIEPKESKELTTPNEHKQVTEKEEADKRSTINDAVLPTNTNAPEAVAVDDELLAIIELALPTDTGQRSRCLFDLARRLKAVPRLAGLSHTPLRTVVRAWYERAVAVIGTKAWIDTWNDFSRAWARARWPHGMNPIEVAWQRARGGARVVLPDVDDDSLPLLATFCRELQAMTAPEPFYLSYAVAAKLLGVSTSTAYSYLGYLEAEGFLHVVKRGIKGGKTATRYSFKKGDAYASQKC